MLHLLILGLALISSVSVVSAAGAQDERVQGADRANVVRPGDRVRLKVWREPDLSGEFAVDENGVVVLPKIGPVDIHELSPDSLRALLVARYSSSLRNPAVEVTVLHRVNVLGAVRNPGLYHVDLTTTVADVLAMAGGVSSHGNQNRIELVRKGKRLPVRLSGETRLADSAILSGDQLLVAERSWVERNTGLIAAGLTGTALILAALIR